MRPISSAIVLIYVVACLGGTAYGGQASRDAQRRALILGVSVPNGWHEDFGAAFRIAKKQGKDLLIDFSGSDWCLPCRWLKSRVFSRPEFVDLTKNSFVLVDADDLKRGGNSPQATERIHQLQKRYGITSFPSVVLATPNGEAYGWTTWSKGDGDSPVAFWNSVKAIQAKGLAYRESLDRARKLTGRAKADVLVQGMSQIRADFLLRFGAQQVRELRQADPSDRSGFLRYLQGRGALSALEDRMPEQGQAPTVSLKELNAVIAGAYLQGETLQDALAFKALLQVLGKDPWGALQSFRELVIAETSRGPFDRGQFLPIGSSDLAVMSAEIEKGCAKRDDPLTQYHALNRLFEHELPSRFVVSCGPYFSPTIDSRIPIGEEFGRLLLASTASLSGEQRAKSLSKPLEGTFFYNYGSIKKVVGTVTSLVGPQEAKVVLPEPYRKWVVSAVAKS